ncbi:MAG: hydroxysqualene dehydroxylase HpnE [Alphaproteobacteria bacterium]
MSKVHIIGAGLAGLSCATELSKLGITMAIYESAPFAGGRCRSFYDKRLDCEIDNGNHLLFSSNYSTLEYLKLIASSEKLEEISPASFKFIEPATGQRWIVSPGPRYFPAAALFANNRVPQTKLYDYFDLLRLWRSLDTDAVGDRVNSSGILYERLWQPLCHAVLNTNANNASATLLWNFIKMSFLRGESYCRPWVFKDSLSKVLIDPALKFLESKNVKINFNAPVKKLQLEGQLLTGLGFRRDDLPLEPGDVVVLAVPPKIAKQLHSEIKAPDEFSAIVNIHFKMNKMPLETQNSRFIGLIGSKAQWVFFKENVLSVTVSDAFQLSLMDNEEIGKEIWAEIKETFNLKSKVAPPFRVIKEREATISQTPNSVANRQDLRTNIRNLFVIGDWTQTDLPATIEGSIQSGREAAGLIAKTLR